MSDLISRPNAIAAITEEMSGAWTESDADFNRGMEMAASIIEALPSADTDMSEYSDRLWKAAYDRGKAEAERTGEWIPVSERLPKERKCVLITDGDFSAEGEYAGNGRWMQYRWSNLRNDIVAWMPLPEPYKGGDTE